MSSRRKNKASSGTSGSASKRSRKTLDLALGGVDDENIDSDEDDETPSYKNESDESEEEEENLDEKKVRLAREYLKKLEAASDSSSSSSEDEEDESDDDDDGNDALGRKLQRERLKREGMFERPMADKIEKSVTAIQEAVIAHHKRPAIPMLAPKEATDAWIEAGYISFLKGHDLTPTCVALQSSGEKAISGSKDHSVILWDIESQKRLETILPHWKKNKSDGKDKKAFRSAGQVLSVACSDDGRFAAVGKRDSTISIFDIRMKNNKGANLVKTFGGHKGAVTCLAFRCRANQLFSGSDDRCIRHYNLDEMMYLETLYGHQFGVTSIDCHRKERPVSVAQDRTARAWKLQEDTHLIFRGGAKMQSADCVSMLRDDWFVTGHQDGVVALWMTEKKRTIASKSLAHGTDGGIGRAIVSVDCLKGSDIAASGSSDGYLRFWKTDEENKELQPVTQIPLHGFLNSISFGPKGKYCVVAVGQEHRTGRWKRIANSKNRIAIVKLQSKTDEKEEEANDESDEKENVEAIPSSEDESESSSE